jgi:hypothetical protein
MAIFIPNKVGLFASISVLLLCRILLLSETFAYVPPQVRQRWIESRYSTEDALKLVEECSEKGKNSQDAEELFFAVKFLDRFARQNYDTHEKRKDLMATINGSWELRLACNSDREFEFYPHPEFRAFAMAFSTVTDDYFGKGIGTNDRGFCFVALGGPSTRDIDRRQVFMNYEDYFINGQQVPGWDLSYYVRGWRRQGVQASMDGGVRGPEQAERKKPILGFTVICANDKVMIVRGSKTGGLAIFRRIDDDMTRTAFGWN